jgi:polar amino acid transport system substrate-binding protein
MNNPGQYKIETDPNLRNTFNFPVQPSAGVESSLKKVDIGRIDGYIFAMAETDTVLKRLELKNVKRNMYKAFEGPIIVPKGPKGQEIANILLPLIQQLRDNGTYAKIMGPMLNQKFIEW